MITIYIYVLDTLADWELGNILAELNSKRFFKKDAPSLSLKTVSHSKEPIFTMGGIKIVPDCILEDICVDKNNMLILPGANIWNSPEHQAILDKAKEFLQIDATVCAICGATVALANFGILDSRSHTSNGLEYLKMASPNYKGENFYIDEPSISEKNLITASSTGALLWTKQIIEHLDVFAVNSLEAWYKYFSTGEAKYFFSLMQTLPSNDKI